MQKSWWWWSTPPESDQKPWSRNRNEMERIENELKKTCTKACVLLWRSCGVRFLVSLQLKMQPRRKRSQNVSSRRRATTIKQTVHSFCGLFRRRRRISRRLHLLFLMLGFSLAFQLNYFLWCKGFFFFIYAFCTRELCCAWYTKIYAAFQSGARKRDFVFFSFVVLKHKSKLKLN